MSILDATMRKILRDRTRRFTDPHCDVCNFRRDVGVSEVLMETPECTFYVNLCAACDKMIEDSTPESQARWSKDLFAKCYPEVSNA